jgi:hypothetical protein
MATKRLLTGSSFVPEAMAVIDEAYRIALAELGLPSESERATQLAKLVLDIAANKTELDVQNLAAEAKTAWAARSSKGG